MALIKPVKLMLPPEAAPINLNDRFWPKAAPDHIDIQAD